MSEKFMVRYFFWLFIGIILINSGCSKQADPLNFVNIDDQYELQLHQTLSPNGGIPSLQINTIRKQECSNAYISHFSTISDNKIQIFLNDILTEGDCISGNEIITEEINLDSPNSAIPIEIILQEVVKNKGTLFTDKTEFELILGEFDGLKISKTHIKRIRPNMIWGSYASSNEAIITQISQYLKSLDLKITYVKGDYAHFYINQDESAIIYNSEIENQITFLIATDEMFENIKSNIQQLKILDPSLVFQATNYDGSALYIH